MTSIQSGSSTDESLQSLWLDLLEEHTDVTPFHRLEYLESLAAATGSDAQIYIEVESERPVAGAVLLTRKRFGVYPEALLPPFTPFTAFLSRNRDHGTLTSDHSPLLETIIADFDIAQVHLQPAQSVIPLPPTWNTIEKHTYISRLDKIVEYQSGWSDNPRRVFRKNVDRYDIYNDNTAVPVVVDLNIASYQRHGRKPLIEAQRLSKFIRDQVSARLVTIHIAKNRETGEADAAIALLAWRQQAYYWIVGSKPGPAMTVLIGSVLQLCLDNGTKTFDFVGANTPSIAEFKRRFGPELVPYQAASVLRPGLLRLAKRLRRRGR